MLIRALVFSLACCLSASLAQAQTLFGHYEFNGNLSNSATGGFASGFGTLEEVNGSGSFATESGAWSWSGATAPGIGFRLPVTGLPADRHTFSLGLVFKVSDVGVGGNYRKIIDFSNGAHDDGLWLVNGKLIAYGALSATEEGNFTANQTISLVFTRNISDVINVYVNGSTTRPCSRRRRSSPRSSASSTIRTSASSSTTTAMSSALREPSTISAFGIACSPQDRSRPISPPCPSPRRTLPCADCWPWA